MQTPPAMPIGIADETMLTAKNFFKQLFLPYTSKSLLTF